jgi:hypothetical protein
LIGKFALSHAAIAQNAPQNITSITIVIGGTFMQTIKRVDIGSAALLGGAVYAAVGLIAGVFIALFGGLLSSVGGSEAGFAGAGLGIFGIIVFPVLYGILGLIGSALAALLYNVIAGVVGGIKVELQQTAL